MSLKPIVRNPVTSDWFITNGDDTYEAIYVRAAMAEAIAYVNRHLSFALSVHLIRDEYDPYTRRYALFQKYEARVDK